MNDEKVYYSNENGVIMRIPVSELVPGVVWGGWGHEDLGPIWFPMWLHPSIACREWGNPPLTEEARGILRDLQNELHEVYPHTLEEWDADIQGTPKPAMRMSRWLGLRSAYRVLTKDKGLDVKVKVAVFRLLKAYIDYPAEHALTLAEDYSPLSREEAAAVIQFFKDCFDETLNQQVSPEG